MISEKTEELVREHWFQSIPVQYRNDGKERNSDAGSHHISSAIIPSPPPPALLERWLATACTPHLAKDQREAKANCENLGEPGAKKGMPRRRRERSHKLPPAPAHQGMSEHERQKILAEILTNFWLGILVATL